MINVIYHRNCFDGICAAWVCSLKFGVGSSQIQYRAMGYEDEFPFNEYGKEDDIIIVDFSFKRDVMEAIQRECKSILVLDHHKTAKDACEGLDFCKFDMNESGASLAWNHFFPHKSVPALVRYIKDRDLWLFQEHASHEVNAFIQSYPMTLLDYDRLHGTLENDLDGVIKAGEAINRYKNTMIQTGADFHWIGRISGYEVPIANATMLFSEIGNELCKRYPDRPFSAYFTIKPNGKAQWGLRSIGDFDVSEIAKKYGGGGHKNAAGFIMNELNFREF